MTVRHKNKTLTTLLAAVAGSVGAHRFYLHGKTDKWAWLHLLSLPFSLLLSSFYFGVPGLLSWSPLILSLLIALLETLVLGLIPDEKWDHTYNRDSGQQSDSSWPLALILVLAMACGATALIATIARAFDLLYTGGAYG